MRKRLNNILVTLNGFLIFFKLILIVNIILYFQYFKRKTYSKGIMQITGWGMGPQNQLCLLNAPCYLVKDKTFIEARWPLQAGRNAMFSGWLFLRPGFSRGID